MTNQLAGFDSYGRGQWRHGIECGWRAAGIEVGMVNVAQQFAIGAIGQCGNAFVVEYFQLSRSGRAG
jgi:hypothetical protein